MVTRRTLAMRHKERMEEKESGRERERDRGGLKREREKERVAVYRNIPRYSGIPRIPYD